MKWRRINYVEKELAREDSVPGAQIQLDHFKKQMTLLDRAMERLYASKADKMEVAKVEAMFEKSRSGQVFKDMRDLFDVTVGALR